MVQIIFKKPTAKQLENCPIGSWYPTEDDVCYRDEEIVVFCPNQEFGGNMNAPLAMISGGINGCLEEDGFTFFDSIKDKAHAIKLLNEWIAGLELIKSKYTKK
mgnify:CR=1 FL=1